MMHARGVGAWASGLAVTASAHCWSWCCAGACGRLGVAWLVRGGSSISLGLARARPCSRLPRAGFDTVTPWTMHSTHTQTHFARVVMHIHVYVFLDVLLTSNLTSMMMCHLTSPGHQRLARPRVCGWWSRVCGWMRCMDHATSRLDSQSSSADDNVAPPAAAAIERWSVERACAGGSRAGVPKLGASSMAAFGLDSFLLGRSSSSMASLASVSARRCAASTDALLGITGGSEACSEPTRSRRKPSGGRGGG